jgi:hypothetical protein
VASPQKNFRKQTNTQIEHRKRQESPEKGIPIQASGHCGVPISRGVKCLVLRDSIFFDCDALKDCQRMTMFDHR